MAEEIAATEKRRYIELAKKQAALGIETPPAILLELADLRLKHGPVELLNSPTSPLPERRRRMELDIDWLVANYAALFKRLSLLEQRFELSQRRQALIGYITLGAVAVVGLLVLVLSFRIGVFR